MKAAWTGTSVSLSRPGFEAVGNTMLPAPIQKPHPPIWIGGMSNPLYALLIAYTNDFLETDDMAAASAGLVFLNGLGAIGGPLAFYAGNRLGAVEFSDFGAAMLALAIGWGALMPLLVLLVTAGLAAPG